MLAEDVNNDGHLIFYWSAMIMEWNRTAVAMMHSMDLCLKGDGKGNFKSLSVPESGFFVKGDGKGLAKIHTAGNEAIWIATQNQDSLMVYGKAPGNDMANTKWISLKPDDFYADIVYKNGNKRRVEFYYGSTYLSQSSRKFLIEKDAVKITFTNFKGSQTTSAMRNACVSIGC